MTTKTTGVIVAGFLAIGIVVGAAGTNVARDNAVPDIADHMRGMTSMMGAGSTDGMRSIMSAEFMDAMPSMLDADHMADMASMMSMMGADMASMMSMMGAGSPMTPNASMGPAASMSPEDHRSHHASPSPAATR